MQLDDPRLHSTWNVWRVQEDIVFPVVNVSLGPFKESVVVCREDVGPREGQQALVKQTWSVLLIGNELEQERIQG
jgi:hypothetical protein